MIRLTILLICCYSVAWAQSTQQPVDSTYQLSELERKRMMQALGISFLRPAVHGVNVNYDETKANPFPRLPDPLLTNSGAKVDHASIWWSTRRPELLELFDREIYGSTPTSIPTVKWIITSVNESTVGDIQVITKLLTGTVDNSAYPLLKVNLALMVTTPALANKPVPMILEMAWNTSSNSSIQESSWQHQVLARGWGYAQVFPTSFQADSGAGLTQGIIGLCNQGKNREPRDWGTLRAWAWGASKVMDYFETDKAIDAGRVGIAGHSRYGKAALVAMAYDQRFAIAHISSSGEGGAKLHRRNFGELLENVADVNEYHWMAGNFIKYAGPLQWSDLPVDSHELIALCAPRPVFVGCGSEGDQWADPKGMFMAMVAAGPVYKLLGKNDLGTREFPLQNESLISGELAYRQHRAGHTPDPNWPTFLEFAARYFLK